MRTDDTESFDEYCDKIMRNIAINLGIISREMMLDMKGPGYLSQCFCVFGSGMVVFWGVN